MGKRGEVAAAITGGAVLLSGIGFGTLAKKEADGAALDSLRMPQRPDSLDENFTIAFRYAVQRGDTLWSIAEQTLGSGARFKEIVALNPELNPDRLNIGDKILVPYEPGSSSLASTINLELQAIGNRSPVNDLSPSRECLKLIQRFEGFSAETYRCPAGVLTIGFGHTRTAKPGMRISLDEAQRLLQEDLREHAGYVKRLVKVPLTQHEFDALVSFVYNLGPKNLESSTLLRKLNQHDYAGAADEFSRWIKAGGEPLRGLIIRRAAEAELFRTP